MELIKFADNCIIERDTGTKDEFDNPLRTPIYEGLCLYQENRVNNLGMVIRRPTVFLPTNDVLIEINDVITVRTNMGRTVKALVDLPRDIHLSITGEDFTQLELKQAM